VTKRKPPPQMIDLMKNISECIGKGRYILSKHACERKFERDIEFEDILYVLKTGYHEREKTSFDEAFQTWKYAIRGKTLENSDIRIIVAFDHMEMIIITIMHVSKV
jgi:Domain of unknown function (DUF4258)